MLTTQGRTVRDSAPLASDSHVLFFAYSANMHKHRVLARCPSVQLFGPAELKGHRLDFTRFSPRWRGGVGDVVVDPRSSVWGLLYSLEWADLERLDTLQDYPRGYKRKETTVWLRISDADKPEPPPLPDLSRGMGSVFDDLPATVDARYEAVHPVWVYFVANPAPFIPPEDTYLQEMLVASVWYHFPLSYREHIAGFLGKTVSAEALYSRLAELAVELNKADPPRS